MLGLSEGYIEGDTGNSDYSSCNSNFLGGGGGSGAINNRFTTKFDAIYSQSFYFMFVFGCPFESSLLAGVANYNPYI